MVNHKQYTATVSGKYYLIVVLKKNIIIRTPPPKKKKQDGDRISKQLLRNIREKRNERPNIVGVSTFTSRNGAHS